MFTELTIVGNIAPVLEKHFEVFEEFSSVMSFHEDYSDKLANEIIAERILPLFPNIHSNTIPSSFCELSLPNRCAEWHIDMHGEYDMFGVAWPSPTQILQYKIPYDISCNLVGFTHVDIDAKIKTGEIQMFTCEPGDIIYIPRGIVHRRNPADNHKKHLLLRHWGIYDIH